MVEVVSVQSSGLPHVFKTCTVLENLMQDGEMALWVKTPNT